MPLLIPNEGAIEIVKAIFSGTATENLLLKLFKSDTTPGYTDTTATYTFADFDGYADKTLTTTISGSTWQTPSLETPSGSPAWSLRTLIARCLYGTAPQVFACSGVTGNTIYGYAVVGATSGKVWWAERFTSSRTLANGDSLSVTPGYEQA